MGAVSKAASAGLRNRALACPCGFRVVLALVEK